MSLNLVHLDFALIYLLLTANTFLALPYVLDRMGDREKKILEPLFKRLKSPFAIAKTFTIPFRGLTKLSSPEWRQELHKKWLDVWNKGKLLATQKRIVAFLGYWIGGTIFVILLVVFIIAANALLLVLPLELYLIMLTVMFAIIPLAPVTNTIIFLAQWLGLVLREGLRPSISRARIQFKAGVLPWFIPLLAVGVCFFVVYSVDSLIERLS